MEPLGTICNHLEPLCVLIVLCALAASAACSTAVPTLPPPTVTPQPIAITIAARSPAETATPTNTPEPTIAPTTSPTPSATATPTDTPTPAPSATPSLVPTPSPAQICANLAATGLQAIRVIYLEPFPELVWDYDARYFRVGLCNTLPPTGTPQGHYKIVLHFPGGNRGAAESVPIPADLRPGLNEVVVGPWFPGLENHRAICVTRAVAQTEVRYNDTPDRIYRLVLWHDGKERIPLPIRCGGDYA